MNEVWMYLIYRSHVKFGQYRVSFLFQFLFFMSMSYLPADQPKYVFDKKKRNFIYVTLIFDY